MVVCNYYLQGSCCFGQNCRNEHPAGLEGSQSGSRPGGAFGQGQSNRPSGFGNSTTFGASCVRDFMLGLKLTILSVEPLRDPSTLSFSADSITKDFTVGVERPEWRLSVYGPAKLEPTYMMGIDLCPEEMRLKAYEAKSNNTVVNYASEENSLFGQADQMYADRLKDVQDTFRRIVAGETFSSNGPSGKPQAPLTAGSTGPNLTPSAFRTSTFGASGGATQGPFSAFSSKPTAFGVSSGPSHVFGSTGIGASQSGPAFPTPSSATFGGFGSTNTPASGQTTSATVQPSGFGAFPQAGKTPSFGASAFGRPSAFGATPTAMTASAFGQPAFGQPNKPPTTFGQSGFGQFAAVSSLVPTNPPSQAPSNGTQAAQQPTTSSAFPPPNSTVSAFGGTAPAVSVFSTSTRPAGFGQTLTVNTGGQSGAQGFNGTLPTLSAGVSAPAAPDPYAHLLPANYVQIMPESIKAAFAREEDFEWGNIPEWIPPTEMR